MTAIQMITRQRHQSRRWSRPPHFGFAAQQALAPLAANEIGVACLSLPIALVAMGDEWVLAAILGLPPADNLSVTQDGRWLGPYIPASIRLYPFSMGKTADDQSVLCMDEGSQLITDGPQGERFFEDDGRPTETITQVLQTLSAWESSRKAAAAAVAALQRHGLIQPWSFSVATPAGERTLGGLARIDEGALGKLSAQALHDLMQHGALALAYCQLLSLPHFQALARAANRPKPMAPTTQALPESEATGSPVTAPMPSAIPPDLLNAAGDLNLDFLSKAGTLRFG